MSNDGKSVVELSEKQSSFLRYLQIKRSVSPAQLAEIEQAAVSAKDFNAYLSKIKPDVPKEVISEVHAVVDEAEKLVKGKTPKIGLAIAKLTEADTKARSLANGHFQQFTVQRSVVGIERLEKAVQQMTEMVQRVDRDMQRVQTAVEAFPRLVTVEDPQEKLQYMSKLEQHTTYWRSKIESAKIEGAKVGKTIDMLNCLDQIAKIRKELAIMKKHLGQDVTALEQRLDAVEASLKVSGKTLSSDTVKQMVGLHEQNINRTIHDLTSPQVREASAKASQAVSPAVFRKARMPVRVRGQAQQLRQGAEQVVKQMEQIGKARTGSREQAEIRTMQGELMETLQDLHAVEQANLDAASSRLKSATDMDSIMLGVPQNDVLGAAAPAGTFDINSVVNPINIPQQLDQVDANQVTTLATAAANALRQQMQGLAAQSPDSDVLFDLGLKSSKDLEQMLANRLGLVLDQATPQVQQLVSSIAQELSETINQEFPNRPVGGAIEIARKDGGKVVVPHAFSLGGQQYGEPKFLASGSFGHAVRYTLAGGLPDQTPEYVVLKKAVNEDAAKDMVNELKFHRHLQGNEGGQGHPNVLGQKGIVRDDQGQIFGVTEFAGGGGLDQLGYAMGAAASVGVLGEQARQVLARNLFLQTIEGMSQLHDRRMVHRDLKPENVFMGADGAVKVADFGSARQLDAQGQVNIVKTSASGKRSKDTDGVDGKFSAPEHSDSERDTISTKSDTFALGVLLTRLASPLQGQQEMSSSFISDWTITKRPDQAATALDRLRQAMLEPDPDQRIDLKSVQFCVYADEERSGEQCTPEQFQALQTAMMEYHLHVGGRIADEQSKLLLKQGEIAELEISKKTKIGKAVDDVEKKIEGLRKEVAELKVKIDVVLNAEESRPYVEALRKASDVIAGSEVLAGRRDDGRSTPDVGRPTTTIDPNRVDLRDEFAAAFRDLGVDPDQLGQLMPAFAKEYRLLKNTVGMLKPGRPSPRRPQILDAVQESAARLRDVVQAALKPDENQTPAQVKNSRNNEVMRVLSRVSTALSDFAGKVQVVAQPQPASPSPYANVPFKTQYLDAVKTHGVAPEKANKLLLKALEDAEQATTPQARNAALAEAIKQLDRDLTILELKRKSLLEVNSAEVGQRMVQQEVNAAKKRFKRYKEAGAAMQLLINSLKDPDVGEAELLDLFADISMPDDLEIQRGMDILDLLQTAGTPDDPDRDSARQAAAEIVTAERTQLLVIFNDETAKVKNQIAANAKQNQEGFDAYRADRKIDFSALATEFRKWKSQLKEAMA